MGLVLLLSIASSLAQSAAASADVAKWTRVNIPAEGDAGNWVLADGSDIKQLTMATDGTLYACAEGLNHTLYKSTDGGRS